jgi:hypothetical protein
MWRGREQELDMRRGLLGRCEINRLYLPNLNSRWMYFIMGDNDATSGYVKLNYAITFET